MSQNRQRRACSHAAGVNQPYTYIHIYIHTMMGVETDNDELAAMQQV